MIKLKEILRGGRQSLMMKGMTGKRMGNLNLGDEDDGPEGFEKPEELDELAFTGEILKKVRADVIDFLSKEHKKLGYANPIDTYHLVQQVLDSGQVNVAAKKIR